MTTTCIIFATDTEWLLAITSATECSLINLPAHSSPESLADSISDALRTIIPTPRRFLLALPSHWCLSATLSSTHLPRRDRRQTLAYRLEEKLPIAAEDFTADYLIGPDHTLAICVPTERLAAYIKAFDAKNIPIEIICPAALLLAADQSDSLALIPTAQTVDLIQYEHAQAIRWYTFPNTSSDLELHLKALSVPIPQTLPTVVDFPSAARRAYDLLIHSRRPLINLRRDALAPASSSRRPLLAVAASIVFFLLALNIAFLYRAAAYASVAADQQSFQENIFHTAFPNQSTPLDVESRLASEGRQSSLSSAAPDFSDHSALLTLRAALSHLPPDARIRLQEITIDPTTITLVGQSSSRAATDAIATTLRANPDFDVSPPRTDQTQDNLVNFTITANLASASKSHEPSEP